MGLRPFDDTSPALASRLFDPIGGFFINAKNQRLCHAMADEVWIHNGIWLRIFASSPLLSRADRPKTFCLLRRPQEPPSPQSSLGPQRHLDPSLAAKDFCEQFDSNLREYLACFHIQAGCGLFHAVSTHETRDHKGKKNAVGHLYALNLRAGLLNHLGLSGKGTMSRKPHDMGTLKRLDIEALR